MSLWLLDLTIVVAVVAGCGERASHRPPDATADGDLRDAGLDAASPDAPAEDGGGRPCFLQRSAVDLSLCGVAFRGIGVNKFDLFHQFVGSASGEAGASVTRPMAEKALDDAAAAGLPTLRVAAVGFWPTDGTTTLWRTAPDDYWAAMDEMFAAARARELYLVPVVWWNLWLFADLAGEPLHATFEPGSGARTMLFEYATEMVGRYADEPTVLFWELTNEANLPADLDFGLRAGDSICLPCGTPERRSAADNFTSDEMGGLLGELATAIHAADPNHLVSGGYSAPRPSAMHLRAQPEWSVGGPDWTADTAAEMREYVALLHPDPLDIVSIHFYESPEGRFGVPGAPSAELLGQFLAAADAIDKPLYVGEFGEVTVPLELAPEGNFTRRTVLGAFDLRVPLSLVWVWEFYQFSPNVPAPGSIEPRVNDALIAAMTEVDGWLTSASDARAEAIETENGGFEDDADADGLPDGWTVGAGVGATDTLAPFLGQTSLRLDTDANDATASAWALSEPVGVPGGDDVVLSAALARDLPPGAAAVLGLIQNDAGGEFVDYDQRALGVGGDGRYLVEYFRRTLAPETRSVQVFVSVGPGQSLTLHVDDVRLSRVEP